jgi:hypothetical protein
MSDQRGTVKPTTRTVRRVGKLSALLYRCSVVEPKSSYLTTALETVSRSELLARVCLR